GGTVQCQVWTDCKYRPGCSRSRWSIRHRRERPVAPGPRREGEDVPCPQGQAARESRSEGDQAGRTPGFRHVQWPCPEPGGEALCRRGPIGMRQRREKNSHPRETTEKDGRFRITVRRADLQQQAVLVASAKGFGPDWADL